MISRVHSSILQGIDAIGCEIVAAERLGRDGDGFNDVLGRVGYERFEQVRDALVPEPLPGRGGCLCDAVGQNEQAGVVGQDEGLGPGVGGS